MQKHLMKTFFILLCGLMAVRIDNAMAEYIDGRYKYCKSNEVYLSYKSRCFSCPAHATCDGTNMLRCASGYKVGKIYPNGTETIGCVLCQKGEYSPSTSNLCTKCAKGSYSVGGKENAQCTPCPKGQYVNAEGSDKCFNCVAGTYTDKTGQTSCSFCPAGTYQPNYGSSSCKSCPEHSTCAGAIQGYCGATGFFCDEGYYKDGDSCKVCTPETCGTPGGGRYGFLMTDPYASTPAPAQSFQIFDSHPGYDALPAELKKYCINNGSRYSFGVEVVCDFPLSSAFFWSESNCKQYMVKKRNPDEAGHTCEKVEWISGKNITGIFPTLWSPSCKKPWEWNMDLWEKTEWNVEKVMQSTEPFCVRKTLYTVIDTAGQDGPSYAYFQRKPSEMAYNFENKVGLGTCTGSSDPDTVTCTCPEKRFFGIDRCYTYIENKNMSKSAVCEPVKYTGCSGKIECQGDYEWNPETKVCAKEVNLLFKDQSMTYPETNATWNLTDWDARYSITESYEKSALMASCDVSNSKITCLCPEKQFLSPEHCEKYQNKQKDSGIIGSCVVGGAAGICYTKYNRCPVGCKKCMTSEAVCDECLTGYTKNSEGKCLNQINGDCPSPLKKSADGCCCVK